MREPAVDGVDNDSDNERHGFPIDEPSVKQINKTDVADAFRSSHAREPSVDQTDSRLSSLGSEPSVGQSGIVDEVNLNVGNSGGAQSLAGKRDRGETRDDCDGSVQLSVSSKNSRSRRSGSHITAEATKRQIIEMMSSAKRQSICMTSPIMAWSSRAPIGGGSGQRISPFDILPIIVSYNAAREHDNDGVLGSADGSMSNDNLQKECRVVGSVIEEIASLLPTMAIGCDVGQEPDSLQQSQSMTEPTTIRCWWG